MNQEDNRLTWIQKDGQPWLVPASECSSVGSGGEIQSYSKWHLAFRIYADILTSKHPEKAFELIQYEHIIYTASKTYSWQNVYLYDKNFRIHISNNPLRTWSVILQLAWNMRLKDRLGGDQNYSRGTTSSKEEHCRRFQRGCCSYGINCKFKHRCTICNKYGHGAHVCRKRTDRSSYPSDDRDYGKEYGRRDQRSDRYHYYH